MTEKPLRAKPAKVARKYRVSWADLLQRVFAVDVLACPDCNGRMQLIAFIAQARSRSGSSTTSASTRPGRR